MGSVPKVDFQSPRYLMDRLPVILEVIIRRGIMSGEVSSGEIELEVYDREKNCPLVLGGKTGEEALAGRDSDIFDVFARYTPAKLLLRGETNFLCGSQLIARLKPNKKGGVNYYSKDPKGMDPQAAAGLRLLNRILGTNVEYTE